MTSIGRLFDATVEFLSSSEVRALATLLTVVSLWLSWRATLRITRFAETSQRHQAADQARFLDDQWQRSNHLVLSNEKYIKYITEVAGYNDADETTRSYLLFNVINPLYSGFNSAQQGIMDKTIFDTAIQAFAANYKGDRDFLMRTIRNRGYKKDFADLVESLLPIPTPEPRFAQATIAANPGGPSGQ